MAKIENKQTNPVLAALANFCCCWFLGYILLGQTRKAVFALVLWLINALIIGGIGSFVMIGIPVSAVIGLAMAILTAIDSYQVAEALQAGQEVDEDEYKMEFLYKIMSIIDKEAIFKGAGNGGSTPPPPPSDSGTPPQA